MLQCSGCDVQHKINQCYPLLGSWGVLWRPSFSVFDLKKILTFSKKPWYKSWIGLQTPNILEARNRDQNKNKKNPFKNQTADKSWLLLRTTGFGDVEVLSDLFLRERLERFHVLHRLDVVPPDVGFVLRQSHRLQPRVGVLLSKNSPKLIPRVVVMLSIKAREKLKWIPRVGVPL